MHLSSFPIFHSIAISLAQYASRNKSKIHRESSIDEKERKKRPILTTIELNRASKRRTLHSYFESDTRMNYRLVLRAECAISQGQNNSVNSVAHDG